MPKKSLIKKTSNISIALTENGLNDELLDEVVGGNLPHDPRKMNQITAYDYGDRILGSSGDDLITGGAGNDEINGGAGNDLLNGGTGNNQLDGGAGNDTVSYENSSYLNVDLSENYANSSGVNGFSSDTLTNIENVIGGIGNDTIKGNSANNILLGNDGDDQLDGGAGNDRLDGGTGNDQLTGGSGSDILTGGQGNDTFIINSLDGTDRITDFNSGDQIKIDRSALNGANDIRLEQSGTATNIQVSVNGSFKTIATLDNVSAKSLSMGMGSDGVFIRTNSDIDKLSSAAGTDEVIAGNIANDFSKMNYVSGSVGSSRDDQMIGGSGDDKIDGGAGNDRIYGGAGNDRIDGGAGNDTVSYEDDPYSVDVNLDRGTARGSQHVSGNDTLKNIENVLGGSGNDTITGNSANNTLLGGSGDDVIDGGAGNDRLEGGTGNDQLTGGSGSDILTGGEGNDTFVITSLDGKDRITDFNAGDQVKIDKTALNGADDIRLQQSGTATNIQVSVNGFFQTIATLDNVSAKSLTVAMGSDGILIRNNSGVDELSSAAEKLALGNPSIQNGSIFSFGNRTTKNGSSNSDVIAGTANNDTINAGDGNDLIDAGTGRNTIDGGAGIDTVSYAGSSSAMKVNLQGLFANSDRTNDTLFDIENVVGSKLDDFIIGNDKNNTLIGGVGNDILDGGRGNDILDGGTGNDTLLGGVGDDLLRGGDGDDLLRGDAGSDILTGGTGKDTFVINSRDGSDIITDFSKGDTLRIEGDALKGAQNIRVQQNGSSVDIQMIVNGSPKTVATLNNVSARDLNVVKEGDTLAIRNNLSINELQEQAQQVAQTEIAKHAQNSWGQSSSGGGYQSGSTTHDTLFGTAGNDHIYAGDGNDLIVGSSGNDLIVGGSGNDTVSYASSTGEVIVDLARNSAAGGGGKVDHLFEIENIIGGSGNDKITGDKAANQLAGGAGNDILDGGEGNDILDGGTGNDILDGGEGNDILDGGTGNDTLNGGFGNDILIGGAGSDTLRGGGGNDTFVINSRDGSDTVSDFCKGDTLRVEGDALKGASSVKFQQNGYSTDVQVMVNGSLRTIATLKSVSADSLVLGQDMNGNVVIQHRGVSTVNNQDNSNTSITTQIQQNSASPTASSESNNMLQMKNQTSLGGLAYNREFALRDTTNVKGVEVTREVFSMQSSRIMWQTESGGTQYGMKDSASVIKLSSDNKRAVSGSLAFGTYDSEASIGSQGLILGHSANLVEVSGQLGSMSKDRQNDTTLGLSTGIGGGSSYGLHWDDSDGDGKREYGFTLDIAGVGVTLKTEDPGGIAKDVGKAAGKGFLMGVTGGLASPWVK
jgi:Ca2+-binding RTX toxin-like protein